MKELSLLQLILAKGVGESTITKIYKFLAENTKYTLDEICADVSLLNLVGIKDAVVNNILNAKESALRVNEKLILDNIKIVWVGDNDYPSKLRSMKNSAIPPVLFYKGNYNLIHKPSIGFCGSRKVSESGLHITDKSVKQFIKKDFVIISGYANGVDIMSHKTALQERGNTIFVLAEGILKGRIKPEIRDVLMDDNHLFVSQFIPELTWNASNAMKRNGTIIGLSDAMMLIESGISGGTYAAGEQTLQSERPLYVIDYADSKPSAKGNTYFIQNGGIPIRGNKEGIPVLTKVFDAVNKSNVKQVTNKEHYDQLMLTL